MSKRPRYTQLPGRLWRPLFPRHAPSGASRIGIPATARYLATMATIATLAMHASAGATTVSPLAADARKNVISLADRHAEAGAAMQTRLAIDLYRSNGLTDQQITEIYETAFLRHRNAVKPTSGLGDAIDRYGLLLGLCLFAVFILGLAVRDFLVSRINGAFRKLADTTHRWFAGSAIVQHSALRRYRANLRTDMTQLKIPFRQHATFNLDTVYVGSRVRHNGNIAPARSALSSLRRLIVVGSPGSGKSVLLRRLAVDGTGGGIPRHLADHVAIVELGRLAGSDVSVLEAIVAAFARYGFERADRFVERALRSNSLLLLFDALDEVPTAERSRVAAALRDFLAAHPDTPTVVTCRDAVYTGELDDVMAATVNMVEFDDNDTIRFLNGWRAEMPTEGSPDQLMATLRDHPRVAAVARNPLMLTILLRLYCDEPGYVLPTSRTDFYLRAADVLLEQWHKERNEFSPASKRAVLRKIASHVQEGDAPGDRRTIPMSQALATAESVLPGLGFKAESALPVLTEITERSGLLILIDGGEGYQFSHQTWQEFFAALDARDNYTALLDHVDTDPSAWREVAKFWCGVADDSTAFVSTIRASAPDLALECVADAATIDDALAEDLINEALSNLSAGNLDEHGERAIGAVAADAGPRGARLLGRLVGVFDSATGRTMPALARCLSYSRTPDAVKALARRYTEGTPVRKALVRLGDLAVDALQGLGSAGHAVALDDLVAIGSPRAGRALARLVVAAPTAVAVPAAWRAAATLSNSAVMQDLREKPIKVMPSNADRQYLWISRSRHFGGLEQSSDLIARMARMISASKRDQLPTTSLAVHPAISVPLCGVQCASLRKLCRQNVSKDLVSAANGLLGKPVFTFDGGGFRGDFAKDATRLSPGGVLQVASLADTLDLGLGPHVHGQTRGDLLIGVLSELSAKENDDASDPDPAAVESFLRTYVERANIPLRTLALLNGMPAAARMLLLHGLIGEHAPTTSGWSGGEARQFFGRHWVFVLAEIAGAAVWLVALYGYAQTLQSAAGILELVGATLLAMSMLAGTRRILTAIRFGARPSVPRNVGLIVLVSTLGVVFEGVALIRGRTTLRDFRDVVLVAGFTPGIVLFTIVATPASVPAWLTAAAWLVVFVALGCRVAALNKGSAETAPLRDVDLYIARYPPDSVEVRSVYHLAEYLRQHRRSGLARAERAPRGG